MKKGIQKILSTAELKEFWNNYSASYISKLQEATTNIFYKLVPLCELSKAQKILEVGCGAGNGLDVIRSIVGSSVPIYACDISEVMLEVASKKRLDNVQVCWGDNENLPFQSGHFDRYIANLSMQAVENPQKMSDEAFRVLAPEGIAVVSVFGKPGVSNLHSIVSRSCKEVGFVSSIRSMFHLQDSASLINILKTSGFSNILTFYSSAGYGITSGDQAVETINDFPMLLELKSKDEQAYNQALNLIAAQVTQVLNAGHALTFECLIARGNKS